MWKCDLLSNIEKNVLISYNFILKEAQLLLIINKIQILN